MIPFCHHLVKQTFIFYLIRYLIKVFILIYIILLDFNFLMSNLTFIFLLLIKSFNQATRDILLQIYHKLLPPLIKCLLLSLTQLVSSIILMLSIEMYKYCRWQNNIRITLWSLSLRILC